MSKRLRVKTSSEECTLANKILKYLRRNKWKRLRETMSDEDVHPDSVLNARKSKIKTGESALHVAAKSGHAESLQVLLELGASPKMRDKKGNLPLHLALKYSLKHYSRSVVLDVVDVLVNVTRDELDVPNANGTTPNRLLRGLEVKKEIEDRHDWDSSSSTSSDDETNGLPNFSDRLMEEASEEYYNQLGKWDEYDRSDIKEETYDEWADRIYSEFNRKKHPKSQEVKPEIAHRVEEPQKPKLKLKLSASSAVKIDVYMSKSRKLFETKENITIHDIPFKQDSSADSVIEIILGNEPSNKVKPRLQDALRKWHPDKFEQWSHGRLQNDSDKETILKIVTHVSQILLSYGK